MVMKPARVAEERAVRDRDRSGRCTGTAGLVNRQDGVNPYEGEK